jgi:hypothetical protein
LTKNYFVITFEFNPSVSGITAICADLSEVIFMMAHTRWRNSYNSAMHACGNSNNQAGKADLAVRACVERLWQIDLEETTEQEEIYTALADLSILKILYRKYA